MTDPKENPIPDDAEESGDDAEEAEGAGPDVNNDEVPIN